MYKFRAHTDFLLLTQGGKVALADWIIAVDGVDVSDVDMTVREPIIVYPLYTLYTPVLCRICTYVHPLYMYNMHHIYTLTRL